MAACSPCLSSVPAMTDKTCLRCDWEGDTTEPECPNCGVQPLYVIGASSSGAAGVPVPDHPDGRGSEARVTPVPAPSGTPSPQSDPPRSPTDPVGSSGPSARSVVGFVLAALVLIVTLGTWLDGSPAATEAPTPDESPMSTPADADVVQDPVIREYALTDGGVPLSFSTSAPGWEQHDRFSLNRSAMGPQGAEAVIFGAEFPDGGLAHPCACLLSPSVGPTVADLAAAVARAPGIELVSGPSDVTVSGHPAKHVVLTVREDVGCTPGFFYAWRETQGGALWGAHTAADTVRVWIVNAGGTRLFLGVVTTDQATPDLEQEIGQIVRSIRLEPAAGKGGAAVAIVRHFMLARNAHDAETAMSLLDREQVRARLMYDNRLAPEMGALQLNRKELIMALEAERLLRVRYRSFACREEPSPGHVYVVCSYSMDSRLRQIQGSPPVQSSFRLGLRSGRIDYLSFPWLSVSFDPEGFHPSESARFVEWLQVEHPDAGGPSEDGTLFHTSGQELILNLTRGSLRFLEGRLQEYERSVGG